MESIAYWSLRVFGYHPSDIKLSDSGYEVWDRVSASAYGTRSFEDFGIGIRIGYPGPLSKKMKSK